MDVISNNSTVEYTTTSWCHRIQDSLHNIIIALILLFIGIILLIWNEGHYVHIYKGLQEGIKATIHISDINEPINNNNDGKLIHIIGMLQSNVPLDDTEFGIHLYNNTNINGNTGNPLFSPIKLHRIVEMYQWDEHEHSETEKNTGGSTTTKTTYSYTKDWYNSIKDSSSFHDDTYNNHINPTNMIFNNKEIISSNITMGSYVIDNNSPIITNKMNNNWYVPLDQYDISIDNIPNINLRNHVIPMEHGYYYPNDDNTVSGNGTTKMIPNNPTIGDIRITYEMISSQIISMIGCQTYNTITPYIIKSSSSSILLVEKGIHNINEMFLHAQHELNVFTWILRGVGFILIFISFVMFIEPIIIVADCIPCIGNIIQYGTNMICFLLSMILSSIIIALSWLVYRPLISILILCSCIGIFTLTTWYYNNKKFKQQNQIQSQYEYVPNMSDMIESQLPTAIHINYPNSTSSEEAEYYIPSSTFNNNINQEEYIPIATATVLLPSSAPPSYEDQK